MEMQNPKEGLVLMCASLEGVFFFLFGSVKKPGLIDCTQQKK